ncbi:MAG: phosphoribosylformylglycinamidine cyclo-ligase [Phycisphaeraceae bacterium]|nr:phosphoribosylformylglycinamidine cyclo-ligase [Phycisphaeraceae bacterium]
MAQARKSTSPRTGLTYADAGIDLDRYDAFIETLEGHVRRTFGPRVIRNPGGFAGLFRLDFNERLFKRNYRDPVLVACTDGVGTKIRLAQLLNIYDTIGIDLVAMNVNDLITNGAEPLFFLDYFAVRAVDKPMMTAVVKGIADGCTQAGCALIGGETAEMGDLYAPGDFDLAGFAVGVVELRRMIRPAMINPGDIVLGLASSGVHSNGYSLVRKVIEHARLDLRTTYADLDPERTLGRVLLTPTRIYADSIVRVLRKYAVKRVITGMAHITGGGLADNLVRALPASVDVVLDAGSWPIPPIFPFLQRRGGISNDEMARVFNMGIGYCVIVKPAFADSITAHLTRLGENVHVIGKIIKGRGKVRIESRKTSRPSRRSHA